MLFQTEPGPSLGREKPDLDRKELPARPPCLPWPLLEAGFRVVPSPRLVGAGSWAAVAGQGALGGW